MKRYQLLLIIILILTIILGIKIYNTNKKPEYSQEQINQILEKAQNLKNYKCTANINDEIFFDYIRNDNKLLIGYPNFGSKNYSYRDYDESTELLYSEEKKIAIKKQIDNTLKLSSSNLYLGIDTSQCNYLKKEQINGIDCIKVKSNANSSYETYIWISIESGLIYKEYSKNIDTNEKKIIEVDYEFNTVTDKDFEIFNFSNYQIIENE